jgi:hypothetical protein
MCIFDDVSVVAAPISSIGNPDIAELIGAQAFWKSKSGERAD